MKPSSLMTSATTRSRSDCERLYSCETLLKDERSSEPCGWFVAPATPVLTPAGADTGGSTAKERGIGGGGIHPFPKLDGGPGWDELGSDPTPGLPMLSTACRSPSGRSGGCIGRHAPLPTPLSDDIVAVLVGVPTAVVVDMPDMLVIELLEPHARGVATGGANAPSISIVVCWRINLWLELWFWLWV